MWMVRMVRVWTGGLAMGRGVGGVAVTKRRDICDAETFIEKESEVSILG